MDYKSGLKVLLGFGLLGSLFYIAEPSRILNHLGQADLGLYLLGVTLFLSTYIGAALRWRNLSNNIGYNLGLGNSFRIISIAYSFNKLFPGNSGDIVRSKIFERYEDIESHGNILGIVALERFLDAVSVTAMLGVSLIFVASRYFTQIKWIIIPFTVIILGFSTLLFLNERFLKRLTALTPGRIRGPLEDTLSGYRSCGKRDLAVNMVYSLYIWVMEALAFYTFILALDLNLGFWVGALVTSGMSLISALPISPGGLGAVDAAGTGMLMFSGLEYSAALSLVMLQRSVGLVLIAAVGALVYILEELQSSLVSS